MASAFNNGTFTFNKEELKDLNGIINELTYQHPDITSIHDVQEGIKHDMQIVFAGRVGLMGKAVAGCTPNEISGVSFSEKTWTPKLIDFRLTHCSADVNQQDKLFNQWMKLNPDYYNIFEGSASSVGAYLVGLVADGQKENLLRKIWFSDTTAETVADGGVFKNGTDMGYFTIIDGLWKQIMTNIPTTSKYYVAAPKNSGANYAAQALASGDAIATLKAMYAKADSRLLNSPGLQFMVTRTLWDGYLNDLESIQNTGAGNTAINESGQVKLTYRGIPVVMVETWDLNINDYQNNGTKWNLPHRAVLTIPTNIPVGTPYEGDFGELDAFYDKVTKKNYIDGIYGLDVKHLENYLTVAAY